MKSNLPPRKSVGPIDLARPASHSSIRSINATNVPERSNERARDRLRPLVENP